MEFLRLFLKQFANKKFSTFSNGLKINRTELSISVLENPLLKLYTEFCSTTYHEIQPLLIRLFCETDFQTFDVFQKSRKVIIHIKVNTYIDQSLVLYKLLGRHGYHIELGHFRQLSQENPGSIYILSIEAVCGNSRSDALKAICIQAN